MNVSRITYEDRVHEPEFSTWCKRYLDADPVRSEHLSSIFPDMMVLIPLFRTQHEAECAYVAARRELLEDDDPWWFVFTISDWRHNECIDAEIVEDISSFESRLTREVTCAGTVAIGPGLVVRQFAAWLVRG